MYIKESDGLGINPILKEHKVTPRAEICLWFSLFFNLNWISIYPIKSSNTTKSSNDWYETKQKTQNRQLHTLQENFKYILKKQNYVQQQSNKQ